MALFVCFLRGWGCGINPKKDENFLKKYFTGLQDFDILIVWAGEMARSSKTLERKKLCYRLKCTIALIGATPGCRTSLLGVFSTSLGFAPGRVRVNSTFALFVWFPTTPYFSRGCDMCERFVILSLRGGGFFHCLSSGHCFFDRDCATLYVTHGQAVRAILSHGLEHVRVVRVHINNCVEVCHVFR